MINDFTFEDNVERVMLDTSDEEKDAILAGEWSFETYDVCDEMRTAIIDAIREERGICHQVDDPFNVPL